MRTASASWIFLTTFFLWNAETESKVYYGCGAVMDPTGKDLIMSPGFPNNYLPGSHCLWQIFIPPGSSIEMETLDFDIYESTSESDPATGFSSSDFSYHLAHKRAMEQTTLPNDLEVVSSEQSDYPYEAFNKVITPERWDGMNNGIKSILKSQILNSNQNTLSEGPGTPRTGLLSIVTQNSDGPSPNYNKPMNLLASTSKVTTNVFQQVSEDATSPSINIGTDPFTTLPPVLDVCPLDVLYITDLVTYSSRFCGSDSPLNKNLTFGSPVEMTEVVLELITTTNRGRGFALLFTYHNQSLVTALGVQESRARENIVLLAVVAAAISFIFILVLVLCLSYRQKICPKREQNDSRVRQVTTQVNGIQNTGLDVNELQLVVTEDLHNRVLESTSQDVSQQMHHEDPTSSTITVTDSHSDDVFVISAGDKADVFTFNTYALQEGSLKRSVTSPASVCDWLTADYTSVDLSGDDKAGEVEEADAARQRTWSSRAFNSLLPQLQMKWRSRSSSGSFTKLVDSCCTAPAKSLNPKNPRRVGSAAQIGENSTHLFSESSDSNASYPLTQSAKLQRKLPPCNLRRTRPYFGLLNESSDCVRSGQKPLSVKENHTPCQTSAMEFTSSSKTTTTTGNGFRAKELSLDFETPNTVFVICEEADDQQPLVFDDQLSPATECPPKKHDGYTADECYPASVKACSHVNTRKNSAGDSTIHCMENKMSLGSAWNLTSQCTTVVGRQSSAVCTNFPSTPIGLVAE
ncbi:uncharacterized protein LOC120935726 isoform X2 [Rana temporaria]|uniref:uncharacterized protein LOC120935726 isoform X2 n=1 Tax=Rana temporaria TaxID=8407 RepID=UPI001AAD3F57|nr:uncharacterized protein LOC120935726 isoform X2 [Rana temporaria]